MRRRAGRRRSVVYRAAPGAIAPPLPDLDVSRYRPRHTGWRAVFSAAAFDPDLLKPVVISLAVIVAMALLAALAAQVMRLTH